MTLLSNASSNTDPADLAILAIVETIRDQKQPATASAVAALIGGAPEGEIAIRLHQLWSLQLLECPPTHLSYQLTELGAELMRRDMIGWSPSAREENRRAIELQNIRDGVFRSRLR
jgi:hypothetical protein